LFVIRQRNIRRFQQIHLDVTRCPAAECISIESSISRGDGSFVVSGLSSEIQRLEGSASRSFTINGFDVVASLRVSFQTTSESSSLDGPVYDEAT
jgi:hypothetical protein